MSINLGAFTLMIPRGTYLSLRIEESPETGEEFLSAVLFTEPPEEGWPNVPDNRKFDDQARVGVSADLLDPESFEKLVVGMVKKAAGNG